MALQDILEAIRRDVDAEVARVDEAAGVEAAALRDRARADAAARRAELATARDARTAEECARGVNRARLRAGRSVREAREDVFEDALAHVRERLARARLADGYPALFAVLLAEARAALPDATVVRVDPRDAALAPHDLETDAALETWGGVEVATGDGRHVRNTLETRLERADPELRLAAARLIPERA